MNVKEGLSRRGKAESRKACAQGAVGTGSRVPRLLQYDGNPKSSTLLGQFDPDILALDDARNNDAPFSGFRRGIVGIRQASIWIRSPWNRTLVI